MTCVAEDPVAVDDTETVAEDSGATTIDVLANDVDADSVGMTIDSATQPANGTVVVAVDGADLTYQPDAELLQHPDRRVTGHVHLHPHPRRLHRHRVV